MAKVKEHPPETPEYTVGSPPPMIGTEGDPVDTGTPFGSPQEGPGTDETYVGTYRTREDAERGLQEKEATISRMQSEAAAAKNRADALQQMMDRFIGGGPTHQPGAPTPPSPYYTTPGHPHTTPTPPSPAGAIDLSNVTLRDPVDDPKGFHQDFIGVLTKFGEHAANQAATAVIQQLATAGQDQQNRQAVWQYFTALHPDLAEQDGLVKAKFLEHYGGRLPESRQIPTMVDHLARETRTELARIRGEQPTPGPSPPAQGRTEVPGGGQPPKPPAPSPGPATKPSLTAELRDMQRKSGFF